MEKVTKRNKNLIRIKRHKKPPRKRPEPSQNLPRKMRSRQRNRPINHKNPL